jgi:serine protease Do
VNRLSKSAGRVLSVTAILSAGLGGITASAQPPIQPAHRPTADDLQRVFQAAVAAVRPCIVRIDTIGGAQRVQTQRDPLGRERTTPLFRQADGPTTGVICSEDGYIITSSFNFLRDPTVITVRLADETRHVARLLARDHPARLALLKIDAEGLSAARWRSREDVRPGAWVMAAGFGHGTRQPAVSLGVVSALRRMDGRALQTDAKISPASYGGPLFDIDGHVLGVCVPLGPGDEEIAGVQWYDSGIGFAIAWDFLRPRLARLRRGQDIERGLLGVVLDPRDPVVGDAEDAPPLPGVQIEAEPQGPAKSAGLQADDIITAIDEQPTPTMVAFRRVMARKAAGDQVVVQYWRTGSTADASLRLASPDELREEPTSRPAGP